ncbi:hypothetical protein M9Y10_019581 [Tritrichomonas musculus]|uniref:Condensation domain-containing protein n=1 Tax=Tritrichomonas musculus TaxID=1915356 RepID=A0ABR2HIT6_9EUKA
MLSTITKRKMNETERLFANEQLHRFNNIYCIEVEDPKYMPEIFRKVFNATQGLFIKSDGTNLVYNNQTPESITIHKIPKNLTNLYNVCDWIYNNFTPNADYALASIAADETRVCVNVNHAVNDGDYCFNVLSDIQDPSKDHMFKDIAPMTGDPLTDPNVLKERFDDFLKNKSEYEKKWPKFQNGDMTFLNTQEVVTLPDTYKLFPPRLQYEMPDSGLSPHIYHAKTGKTDHMSEYLWTGLALAVNAKNRKWGPIGVQSCYDLRRLAKHFDHHFGNAFTDFALCVQHPLPGMTIGEINQKFRDNFTILNNSDWICKEYLDKVDRLRDYCPVAHVSNVGPIKFHSPIKDFTLTVAGKEEGLRPFLQTTAYSKIKTDGDMDQLVLYMRYSPAWLSNKSAKDIFDTWVYFLKTADPSKKAGDVLDELIHFQDSLQ